MMQKSFERRLTLSLKFEVVQLVLGSMKKRGDSQLRRFKAVSRSWHTTCQQVQTTLVLKTSDGNVSIRLELPLNRYAKAHPNMVQLWINNPFLSLPLGDGESY
jgi:hypothetical protein